MGGEDEMELINDLPEGLRRDIKRHLCVDLIRKVNSLNSCSLEDLFRIREGLWLRFCFLMSNGPNPPLVDIVLFCLPLLGFPKRFKNTSANERFSHPYKECFVR